LKPLSTDRTQVAARRYTYEIAITHQFLEKGLSEMSVRF